MVSSSCQVRASGWEPRRLSSEEERGMREQSTVEEKMMKDEE